MSHAGRFVRALLVVLAAVAAIGVVMPGPADAQAEQLEWQSHIVYDMTIDPNLVVVTNEMNITNLKPNTRSGCCTITRYFFDSIWRARAKERGEYSGNRPRTRSRYHLRRVRRSESHISCCSHRIFSQPLVQTGREHRADVLDTRKRATFRRPRPYQRGLQELRRHLHGGIRVLRRLTSSSRSVSTLTPTVPSLRPVSPRMGES